MIFKKPKKQSKLNRWITKNKFLIEFAFTVNVIFMFQLLFMAVFIVCMYHFWNGKAGIILVFSILGLIGSFKMYQMRLFYKESFIKSITSAAQRLRIDEFNRRDRRKILRGLKKSK